MTFGAEIWGPALIQAAGSTASGYLAGKGGGKESKIQKAQRKLVDRLIESLTSGGGPFGDLFSSDENAFKKSFVEPAQAMFRNQIAPQIQQQFIASGQQRGTGLEDQLSRAGVDLDAMLNQQYYQFQQDALNRKQNAIGQILSGGAGAPGAPSGMENALGGLGGFLQSDAFGDLTSGLFKKKPAEGGAAQPERKGFENT